MPTEIFYTKYNSLFVIIDFTVLLRTGNGAGNRKTGNRGSGYQRRKMARLLFVRDQGTTKLNKNE